MRIELGITFQKLDLKESQKKFGVYTMSIEKKIKNSSTMYLKKVLEFQSQHIFVLANKNNLTQIILVTPSSTPDVKKGSYTFF